MQDQDGAAVASAFYEKLFAGEAVSADAIPYALDHAMRQLRESGAPLEHWATFIHVGA
jgi:CHAT domain-containing protein